MTTPQPVRMTAVERRGQILDAARAVFARAGLGGARIQEIAAEAQITDALIYKHFEGKDELYEEAVIAPLRHAIESRLEPIFALPPDAEGRPQREMARAALRDMLEALVESIDLMGVVMFGDRDRGRDFYTSQFRPLVELGIAAVRENLDRWEHRDFDPEVTTEAVWGMALGLAIDWSMRGVRPDLDSRADELIALIFDGLNGP